MPLNSYRLEVHHLTYDRLGKERDEDLIVLCPSCHRTQHNIPEPEPMWARPIANLVEEQLRALGVTP